MHATAPAGPGRSRFPVWLLATLAIVVLTAAILYAMGRVPICECGEIKLWHGEVRSSENSQHVADWYTPSHIIHGFLFYGLFHLVARRRSLGFRLFGATVIEALWEIVENSPAVIERYRSATVALDYFGDSILNSVSDIGFMMLGFWLAMRLPVWLIVAAALVFEISTAWLIRDNLTLNVLMLLWPLDAVKAWQNAG